MFQPEESPLVIDLDQFKLHLNIQGTRTLSLHFDTPSRRFYLSVIALVVEEMKKGGNRVTVSLADHVDTLILLNETVGQGAGSSEKEKLLPRIYRKWKDALPDLEGAPLFKVIGLKKGYADASGKVYPLDDKTTDAWANLFEYKGSRDTVYLRFSVEKLGIAPKDVAIVYENERDVNGRSAWHRFIASLKTNIETGGQAEELHEGEDGIDQVYAAETVFADVEEMTQPAMATGRGDDNEIPQKAVQVTEYLSIRGEKGRWAGNQWKGRSGLYAALLIVVLGLISFFAVRQYRNAEREAAINTAYNIALPQISQLLEHEDYAAAHALAQEIQPIIPDDPTLARYITDATNSLNISTTPPGARVSYRPYTDPKGPWIDLGTTPVQEAMVPVGMHCFKIEKEGYGVRILVRPVMPRNAISSELADAMELLFGSRYAFDLYPSGSVPKGMIPIERGRIVVSIKNLPAQMTGTVLDRFFVDETEVTNREYKEFVDAGGYANPAYWKEAFIKDGHIIPWAEAMKTFVDHTGRAGPSAWELGDYPQGQDDYPVSGVSWYEAAAYAEFRGKTLPTIYHWARATFPVNENTTPLAPFLIPQSNIEGKAVAPVGSFPGISSSGARDMAGNVREWCWNGNGENRYCLGGMWQDPAYMVNDSYAPSGWDRSSGNGFRCALYPPDAPVSDLLRKDLDLGLYDPYSIPACSKEAFDAMKGMLRYEKTPLRPIIESRQDGGRGWRRETVTVDTAYNDERLIIHLDLPTDCPPPYPAVIYFPGGNAYYQPRFSRNFLWEPWDLIPKSGRALITPIYSCTFERGAKDPTLFSKKGFSQRFSEYLKDLGRTIDYLEGRPDIDMHHLTYLGVSSGAMLGPMLAAYEERIQSLILVSGCIALPVTMPRPKGLVHPLVKIPVLMLNGRYDYTWPVASHQKPLFDLLGAPPEHKKHVIYETGHLPLSKALMLKEIFGWLDLYQGTVHCSRLPKTERTGSGPDRKGAAVR